MKRKINQSKGITLMALIVTIIVLLILAGISIAMLTGNNGILQQATKATEKTIEGEEKEEISLAMTSIKIEKISEKLSPEITAVELETELKTSTKKNVQVTGSNILTVEFLETGNIYDVDGEGNITEPNIKKQVEDETPGEFEGDGSESNPYKLKSIEDLVGLSKKVNAGETYSGKYFDLDTDLDFRSTKSYVDATRTDMGDVNHDGIVDELMVELTTGRGFEPIGFYESSDIQKIDTSFNGIFDGKNYTIYNLYQDAGKSHGCDYGFIGQSEGGTIEIRNLNMKSINIKNLSKDQYGGKGAILGYAEGEAIIENCTTEGSISVYGGCRIGGIVGYTWDCNLTIKNCINYCNLSGSWMFLTGGIVGQTANGEVNIENCTNYGKIDVMQKDENGYSDEIGGIVGEFSVDLGNIKKCINRGNLYIKAYPGRDVTSVGGIAGYADGNILECINYGFISGSDEVSVWPSGIGGIVGERGVLRIIDKCINYGEIFCINESYVGGILGRDSYKGEYNIENCYNIGDIHGKEFVGGISGENGYNYSSSYQVTGIIKNSYNIGKITGNTNIGGIAGITHTETNSTIENSYYLLNSAEVAYNTDTGNTSIAEVKTEEEMKQEAFVELLNQNNEEKVWIKDDENDGYPKLSFETSN